MVGPKLYISIEKYSGQVKLPEIRHKWARPHPDGKRHAELNVSRLRTLSHRDALRCHLYHYQSLC